MKRIVFILFSCLFLYGCASIHRPLTSEYKQSIQNIAVVSVLGNTFEGVKIGTTVVNNDAFKENFSQFGMDDKIEESISGCLRERDGYNVVANVNLREFFRGAFDYNARPEESLARLRSDLSDMKDIGIDAVLVISSSRAQFEETPVYIKGYGVVVRNFLMMSYAKNYFLSRATLVDTAGAKMVFDRNFYHLEPVEVSKWQNAFVEFSDLEQEEIANFLNKVVNADLCEFLKKYNF